MAAELTALSSALERVDGALKGVSSALAGVWSELSRAAQAAETILSPEVDAGAKRDAWELIEQVRYRCHVPEALALELIEALHRGAWRKASEPFAYIRRAVRRGEEFRIRRQRRKGARFVALDDLPGELPAETVTGSRVWAFEVTFTSNREFTADQRAIIAARLTGITREQCAEHLEWPRSKVETVWRSLGPEKKLKKNPPVLPSRCHLNVGEKKTNEPARE